MIKALTESVKRRRALPSWAEAMKKRTRLRRIGTSLRAARTVWKKVWSDFEQAWWSQQGWLGHARVPIASFDFVVMIMKAARWWYTEVFHC